MCKNQIYTWTRVSPDAETCSLNNWSDCSFVLWEIPHLLLKADAESTRVFVEGRRGRRRRRGRATVACDHHRRTRSAKHPCLARTTDANAACGRGSYAHRGTHIHSHTCRLPKDEQQAIDEEGGGGNSRRQTLMLRLIHEVVVKWTFFFFFAFH